MRENENISGKNKELILDWMGNRGEKTKNINLYNSSRVFGFWYTVLK